MIRLFCGYDAREAIGFHVFVASVLERATAQVSIHALDSKGLPQGSNAFTYSRFLVPWLCGFSGRAIYADASDMLMLSDVAELEALFDSRFAVQVVKHPDYESRHARKYVGTEMECEQSNYSRKNWMSCALFNCSHPVWLGLTPEAVSLRHPLELLQLQHLKDDEVGDLPAEWNVLVDEGQETANAKLLHFTAGIPHFPRYAETPGADKWFAVRDGLLEFA